jgi:hypothetical protein
MDFRISISNPTVPQAKKLTKDDVWGRIHEDTFEVIDYGMCVARGCGKPDGEFFTQEHYERITAKITDHCPVWDEPMDYKSVTVICLKEQQDEVTYWLEYVDGSNCVSKIKDLPDGKVAIRANYMCW